LHQIDLYREQCAHEQHTEQDVRLAQRELVCVELRHQHHGEPQQYAL
jgi:hypothetical protein